MSLFEKADLSVRASGSLPVPLQGSLPLADLNVEARRHERAIIRITAVAHAICHIGELIFPGVMVAVMREFQLEPHLATAMALLGYVLMGFGAVPVGIWADAWGPRRVMFIYFVAMAGAGLLVALSANIWSLFAALTVLGLAASIYHPTGLAMLSLGVRPAYRGRAMGVNGVAGSLGVALGPLIGMVAAAYDEWRLAYLLLAALALLAALWMWLSRLQYLDRVTRPQPSDGAAFQKPGSPPTWHWLPLAGLFLIMMLGGFNYRCLVTVLPTYLSGHEASGGALVQGGLATSMVLLIGGIGQYFGGWAGDRFGARGVYLALIGSLIPLAVVLGLVGGTTYALVLAGLYSICAFGQQPVENSILAECTSVTRRSLSYGTKFALTFGVGALGSQVVGWIWHWSTTAPSSGSSLAVELWNWAHTHLDPLGPVFLVIAASALMMAGMLLLVMRAVRRSFHLQHPNS